MFTWDNIDQSWKAVTNTNINTLVAGTPYRLMVRGDRTISMATNTPTPTNTVLRSEGILQMGNLTAVTLGSGVGNYSLVANPYQATVNLATVTKSNLNDYYIAWDANVTGANGRGAYVTYDLQLGINNNGGSAVNQYLQPAQSFFVVSNSNLPSTISFKESDKSTTTNLTAVYRSSSNIPILAINLRADGTYDSTSIYDGVKVAFANSFSNSVDQADASKLLNPDENLGVLRDGKLLSIEKRHLPNASDTIPLQITQYRNGNYILELNWENQAYYGLTAFLKDRYTQNETAINSTGFTRVTFQIDSSSLSAAANRFYIVFRSTNPLPLFAIKVNGNWIDSDIKLGWSVNDESSVTSYELEKSTDGVSFKSVYQTNQLKGANELYNWIDRSNVGRVFFYRIKAILKSGNYSYSEVVNLKRSSVAPMILVSPNPVKGNVIRVLLSNMNEGKYQAVLTSSDGKMVFERILNISSGNSTIQMDLPLTIARGNYSLKLVSLDQQENLTTKLLLQ